jgi:hypothetical protein
MRWPMQETDQGSEFILLEVRSGAVCEGVSVGSHSARERILSGYSDAATWEIIPPMLKPTCT